MGNCCRDKQSNSEPTGDERYTKHKLPHSVLNVPRWKEKHGFNGNLTIQGTTELLKRLREEQVRARSQKKKDRLDKETEAALSSDSSRNICEVSICRHKAPRRILSFLFFFNPITYKAGKYYLQMARCCGYAKTLLSLHLHICRGSCTHAHA